MPALELMDRNQTAVLWPFDSYDDHGQAKVSDEGVEVEVRWVPRRREVLDAQGNTIGIDVTVIADREIEIGSQMWLGTLDEIPGTSEVPTSNLMYVATKNITEDIKGRNTRYEHGLVRANDVLPTV